MTQINPPGYPLPDGELGEDDLVCQLVYLPDRPEYWQALLAAVSYFSTWKAWERDDDKRGKDAAANWRLAFELTIGCWRMTCLEELTQTVTDILELLQTRKDCCDDNITYLPVDGIETDIVPFEDDPPEVYGETEIGDWDEWAEHVCYNAHAYVDYLAHAGDSLWEAAKSSSIIIGLIAALLSLLAFSGIGLPIAFGLAAGVVSGIVLGGQIATFAGTREAIEDARDNIVCAIIQGTGIAAAVEDALDSGVDWDLFYQFIPYENAMSIIYEGGHDSEFLPAETREDCVCEEPPAEFQLRWDLESDPDAPWKGTYVWNGTMYQLQSTAQRIEIDAGEFCIWLGVDQSETLLIRRFKFSSARFADVEEGKIQINHDGGQFVMTSWTDPYLNWYDYEEFFDPPLEITHPMNPCFWFDNGHPNCWVSMGFIEIDLDIK
jgi:hypothetical protein